MTEPEPRSADQGASSSGRPVPLLSVVVPVFNQAASIVGNIRTIRERVAEGLEAPFELIVVSDGSIDATEDQLLASSDQGDFRVFHYDRNLGKGYAVKLGALESRGSWVGFIDADLDLDPRGLAEFVRVAEAQGLDFAIGSKRHPDSAVHYPPSRVAASWLFQQLVRVLFRLDVKDTQVGLKVFSRDVADQVLPFLLVKRFAFDIELLAVGRAFGFGRVGELPVQLDYRFTGSGVRSRAVLRALIDTAAIFYRLRILRYYQRRRALTGAYGWTRPREHRPTVSVIIAPGGHFRESDYPAIEAIHIDAWSTAAVQGAAADAAGDVLAVLEPGARAAANWISATTPFFARDEVGCVVTPKIAPLQGSVRSRAAAAIAESRLGGLVYFRYTPGNVRFVDDFPTASFVVRRRPFLALPGGMLPEEVPRALAAAGEGVLYTPESVIVIDPLPLFRPHLARVIRHGRDRGRQLRSGRVPAARPSAVAVFVVIVGVGIAIALEQGGGWLTLVASFAGVYVLAISLAAVAAALRFQSAAVGALAAIGTVCTHAMYLVGAMRGLLSR
jgi:glycosyltransferase involved in cell wall biosynthesis